MESRERTGAHTQTQDLRDDCARWKERSDDLLALASRSFAHEIGTFKLGRTWPGNPWTGAQQRRMPPSSVIRHPSFVRPSLLPGRVLVIASLLLQGLCRARLIYCHHIHTRFYASISNPHSLPPVVRCLHAVRGCCALGPR